MDLIPLHPDFGAQVKGISLLDVICDSNAFAQVRTAFDEYSLLLWRRQHVTDDIQATFARAFGALELTKVGQAVKDFITMNNIGPAAGCVRPSALISPRSAWHPRFLQAIARAGVRTLRTVIPSRARDRIVSTRAQGAPR